MKRKLSILAVAVLIPLLTGGYMLIGWTQRPLGPAMNLNLPPQLQAGLPEAQPARANTCGEAGIMQLIVHGLASDPQEGHFGADAVRLVVVNFDVPSAVILSIPVAVRLDTPVLAKLGVERTTISQVYQEIWDETQNEPEEVRTEKASEAVAQTIVDNFAFVPDHYIIVEQQAFVAFIDELGGVEVDLPSEVDGTSEGYGTYPAGPQRLDGLHTLNLARLITPPGYSEYEPDYWGRLARQDAILQGMRETALNPANVLKIPDLISTVGQAVTTDLSIDQMLSLLCMVKNVGKDVSLLTVGPDLVKINQEGRLIPDVEGIKALIAAMQGEN
jgi:anionic cell wall polymer biosynthesis LytR-Cps2A-Psr (LCP) family protein